MSDDVYVVLLSGPERTRAGAEVALELAGVPQLPDNHHARMGEQPTAEGGPAQLSPLIADTDEPHGFIHCVHGDVNVPMRAVEDSGWALRIHYPMPDKPKPDPMSALAATVEEMQARIAAMEARA